jgi:hypothetical protein
MQDIVLACTFIFAFLGLLLAFRASLQVDTLFNKLIGRMDETITPELLGGALKHFFTGNTMTDEEGNEIELSPQNAAFVFGEGLVARGVAELYPRVAEDIPVFMASIKSSAVAKQLADQSHVAKGFSKLGPGIKGLQGVQSLISMGMESFGKGAMGDNDLMQKGMAALQMYEQAKDMGIIGGGGNGAEATQSQLPPPSGHNAGAQPWHPPL